MSDRTPTTTPTDARSRLHGTTSGGTSTTGGHTSKTAGHTASTHGYDAQVQKLAPPTQGAPGTFTLAGVTLPTHPSDTDLAALEHALGPDVARRVRAAAADGGTAVLALLEPWLPAGAKTLPVVTDLAEAYARWARRQPPLPTTSTTKGADDPHADDKHALALGEYGLMVDLEAALGERLGLLASSPGRSVGVLAKGAVSVEGVYLAMGMALEAEHEADGFRVKGQATFSIGVGTTAENASLTETIAVTGHGDDAVEAMHMAGLAIERFLRSQQFDWKNPSWDNALATGKKFLVNLAAFEAAGPMGVMGAGALALAGAKIADALWGKDFERDVAAQMDDDDYGEQSMGVGVDLNGGSDGVELGVGVGYTHTTKVSNVNGAVGSSTSDTLSGAFSLSVEGGGFVVDVGGHLDVPTSMETAELGLEIGVARKDHEPPVASTVADLVATTVAGLARKADRRAGGWLARVADALAAVCRAQAMLEALKGTNAVTLSADYDAASGDLAIAVVVSRTFEEDADAEMAEVAISFTLGQEILAVTKHVGRP